MNSLLLRSILSLFLLSFLIRPSAVFATSDFLTDYQITYSVDETGLTHASLNGILTNQTSKTYATQYRIVLGFQDIENVQVRDSAGIIAPNVVKQNNGYQIQFPFTAKVAGKDNKLHFTISFDTTDIAKHAGQIWEVNIPGLANQADFHTFQIAVKVPTSFGTPTLIKPYQQTPSLTFNKEQLGNSGISLAFGNKQVFRYTLTYHLKNKNVFPIKTEIALPPTTNYQQVILNTLSPQPEDVLLDKDGNWLAQYYLLPSQKIDVVAGGNVSLSLHPNKDKLTQAQIKEYLGDKQYWESNNSLLKAEAGRLKTPEAIYQYVVKTLHYDFTRVTNDAPRVGAVGVMKNPNSAVCLEFTDLFIALARASGIPAREVDGYAYTQNTKQRPLSLSEDILHAWPEYYDTVQQKWIMVDPTWGNTTNGVDYFHVLDFDHVAFVIKGAQTDYPIPAGGYKSVDEQHRKDIFVSFGNTQNEFEQVALSPELADKYFAGFPMQGLVKVKNTGKILTTLQPITIRSVFLSPHVQQLSLPAIPPDGYTEQPFAFTKVAFLTNDNYPFTIQLADHTIKSSVVVAPIVLSRELIIGGIICVIFTCIISFIAIKTRRIHVP